MSSLDTVFGIDHYKFSDLTANKGFHNTVTQPLYVTNPPTGLPPITTTNPIIYAFQDSGPAGVLQYSRGPTNAVPTPLTSLQSAATPLSITHGMSVNIFDFTGLARAFAFFSGSDTASLATVNLTRFSSFVIWTGSVLRVGTMLATTFSLDIQPIAVGNILTLQNSAVANNYASIFWTLNFLRLS
jgi:hypothetical protein